MSPAHPTHGLRLSLPATSANLGPGFDCAGLALSMHLVVEAHAAPTFQIHASGRNPELCGDVHSSLILQTYREVLDAAGVAASPLRLQLHNEIPLGMGCGSSAAALLAGVLLADHFGHLGLSPAEIVTEASQREGHPDNVAACWYGGFTVSAQGPQGVEAATFAGDPYWQLLLALPAQSLATRHARALLPGSYGKADAVFNVQRTALLVAAFAQQRLDLLAAAMQDRMHQPYRTAVCPLLETLLPLGAEAAPARDRFAGVALSGAGPSVLLFLPEGMTLLAAETRLQPLLDTTTELLPVQIAEGTQRTALTD